MTRGIHGGEWMNVHKYKGTRHEEQCDAPHHAEPWIHMLNTKDEYGETQSARLLAGVGWGWGLTDEGSERTNPRRVRRSKNFIKQCVCACVNNTTV